MGENHFASVPTALYGAILLLFAIAYLLLQSAIVCVHGNESVLARAVGRDVKGRLSPVAYLLAMGVSFVSPRVACLIYAGVAMVWLIPDRRIERELVLDSPVEEQCLSRVRGGIRGCDATQASQLQRCSLPRAIAFEIDAVDFGFRATLAVGGF